MIDRRVLPYGSWPSPITIDDGRRRAPSPARAATRRRRRLLDRGPARGGRPPGDRALERARRRRRRHAAAASTRGRWPTSTAAAGTRSATATVYFSNVADGRIYRQARDAAPVALHRGVRIATAISSSIAARRRLLCVREDIVGRAGAAAMRWSRSISTSGAVDGARRGLRLLLHAAAHPDGKRLAWLSWRHPNMPWDTTELWVAEVDDGRRRSANRSWSPAAARSRSSSPSGRRTDRSSSRRIGPAGGTSTAGGAGGGGLEALAPMEAEFAGRSGSSACAGSASPTTARSSPWRAAQGGTSCG